MGNGRIGSSICRGEVEETAEGAEGAEGKRFRRTYQLVAKATRLAKPRLSAATNGERPSPGTATLQGVGFAEGFHLLHGGG
jgi:hypothetical protein